MDKMLLEKMKQLLLRSGKTAEQWLQEFDKDNSGSLTMDEFRRAIKSLTHGLQTREID